MFPGNPGTVIYIDESGGAHSNRVGAVSNLVRWQPVDGQPGVYTDGTETSTAPTTDQVPPGGLMRSTVEDAAAGPTDPDALAMREEPSMDPQPSPSRRALLPASTTGPYRRVSVAAASAFCNGVLATDANLNPEFTATTAMQDSAYMYMTPWTFSKYSNEKSSYWTTGGDFGFKFSHHRRSWDSVALLPGGFMSYPTRIPCGANIQVNVVGAQYDKKSGNELMTVVARDLDNSALDITFVVPEDKGLRWDAATMSTARVISIAQPHEGTDGAFHLGGRWTNSVYYTYDTGGTPYAHNWSERSVLFESYPTQKTLSWTKMPVVTTNPAQSQAKDMEIVSIDAR